MTDDRSSQSFRETTEASHSADRLTEALDKLESVASPDAYWYMDDRSGVFDRFVEWQERRKRERLEAQRRGAEALAIARQRERFKMRGEPRLTRESRSQRRMSIALAGFVIACAVLGAVIGGQLRKESFDHRVDAGSVRVIPPASDLASPSEVVSAPLPSIPPENQISGGDSLDAFMPPSAEPTVRITESPFRAPDVRNPAFVERKKPSQPQEETVAVASTQSATVRNAPTPRLVPAAPIRARPAVAKRTASRPEPRPVVIWPHKADSNEESSRVVTVYAPPSGSTSPDSADSNRPRARKATSAGKRRTGPARLARVNRSPWRPSPQERKRIDRNAELAFQGEYRYDANRGRRKPSVHSARRRDDWRPQPLSTLDPKHQDWGWD